MIMIVGTSAHVGIAALADALAKNTQEELIVISSELEKNTPVLLERNYRINPKPPALAEMPSEFVEKVRFAKHHNKSHQSGRHKNKMQKASRKKNR